jgi:hypothetical protein
VSKTFVSVALGIAEAEGRLALDDLALRYYPELIVPRAHRSRAACSVMLGTGAPAAIVPLPTLARTSAMICRYPPGPAWLPFTVASCPRCAPPGPPPGASPPITGPPGGSCRPGQ